MLTAKCVTEARALAKEKLPVSCDSGYMVRFLDANKFSK